MPELTKRVAETEVTVPGTMLLPRCGNSRCRTGWIHLWRSRSHPRFEGKWACSPACMVELLASAMRRETAGGTASEAAYVHRMPLGLMLLEQGRITREQLDTALRQQRDRTGRGGSPMRIGQWLIAAGALSEMDLVRALAVQWSSPVLSLSGYRPEPMVTALPRLLAELTGSLPACLAAGRRLHLAFAGDVDRSVSYAVQRMTGLRLTMGVAADAEFGPALQRYLEAGGPRTRFLEAASETALAEAAAKLVEREKPVEAKLVRVHRYYWLRFFSSEPPALGLPRSSTVQDFLCVVDKDSGQQAS